MYRALSHLIPTNPALDTPERIVLIRPCCIGDVVVATAALQALRKGYPDAHITFAVGGWSRNVLEDHPMVDAILDTGPTALPVKSLSGFWKFVSQLRTGQFDMAISLVRSPLMSAAVLLSGIPNRIGLDSGGRGFGYNVRVPVDPKIARHEAEIYLDTMRALGLDTTGCYVNIPVQVTAKNTISAKLSEKGIKDRFIVIHPAGGRNPGMVMDSKRWPPQHFAALADKLARRYNAQIVLLGGPQDGDILSAVQEAMKTPHNTFQGTLAFQEIAALAAASLLYIGNDTGLTHLAAAARARTAMILGPSDPARYAPFTPESIALWKPTPLRQGGVAEGVTQAWNWEHDGIGVDTAFEQLQSYLTQQPHRTNFP